MAFAPASSHPDPDRLAVQLMQRVHLRDGLAEIYVGLAFLLAAAMYGSLELLERNLFDTILFFALMVASIGFGLAGPRLLLAARRRWLSNRAGYMKPKPPTRQQTARQLGALAISMLVAIVMAAVLIHLRLQRHWDFARLDRATVLLAGVGLGSAQIFLGRHARFYVTGTLDMLAGLTLVFFPLSSFTAVACLLAFSGLLALLSGLLVLFRFLRLPVECGEPS